MIIKSHIRGGYMSASDYLKNQGENEVVRVVNFTDPKAQTLDEAFRTMWLVGKKTKCKKPLHHISINPVKGERLTDDQVMTIVERCEQVYGYKPFRHQRVLIEHVKDGRQHFHVIWNRVDLLTAKSVWPACHWKKSIQIAREMEKELGLKRLPKRRRKRSGGRGSRSRFMPVRTLAPPKSHTQKPEAIPKANNAAPMRPLGTDRKRWPTLAVLDWEVWGHEYPAWFFAKWPELAFK